MLSDEEDEMYSYFLPHGIADDDLGDVHAPLSHHLSLDTHVDDDEHGAATAMSAAVGALSDDGEYDNMYYNNRQNMTRQPMIQNMVSAGVRACMHVAAVFHG